MGDLYQPVGVVCLTCGETFVTVPVRIHAEPGWNACQRCSSDRTRAIRVHAAAVFHANGLELLGPCRGEYTPQRTRCMTCGVERLVSYHRLQTGSSPLCWTCTHGIRPDEPHRVYLFHFPALNVMKVGLTHNRHDRRLFQHMAEGGELIDTIVVADRESARRLEQLLKARYESWLMAEVGPADFPQGGGRRPGATLLRFPISRPKLPQPSRQSSAIDWRSAGSSSVCHIEQAVRADSLRSQLNCHALCARAGDRFAGTRMRL